MRAGLSTFIVAVVAGLVFGSGRKVKTHRLALRVKVGSSRGDSDGTAVLMPCVEQYCLVSDHGSDGIGSGGLIDDD